MNTKTCFKKIGMITIPKKAYETFKEANEDAKTVNDLPSMVNVKAVPFKCSVCGKFHLYRKNKKNKYE